MSNLEKDQRAIGKTTSRKDKGLEWSFTAIGFETFWLQSNGMSMAHTQAESTVAFIGANQKEGWVDLVLPVNVN